jgi:glycosyltransferase involved in cell wall biosynthesis
VKILHVSPTYVPAWRHGGPIYAVHGLCRELARRGHEVSVFTTNIHGDGVLSVTPGLPAVLENVEVTYFEVSGSRRLYRSKDLRQRMRERAKEFDILHLHSLFLWPTHAASRVAQEQGLPYVVSPRGMLVKDLIRRRGRWRKTLWLRLFDRRTIERARALHATSELEATEARRFRMALPPIAVIPNGVDVEALELKEWSQVEPRIHDLIDHGRFFLYLGRISWKKGLDRLLDAFANVPLGGLVLAGPDDEQLWPRLHARARALGIQDRVHYVGAVAGFEKAALLRSADCLVLPSYSENFGNAALEAMAVGCPVVVTPEVGIAALVSESGAGVVAAGEPAALAQALQSMQVEAERRGAMGRRGIAAAERFTWPRVAEEMERLYGAAIGSARS